MRAVVIHRHGGPDVLTLERDWPHPVAGPGEIVVRVSACALNYLDIFTREGMPGEPTPLPHITGAGGGVGLGAVQIAKLMGARVIAMASTKEKLERIRDLGADEVINYVDDVEWDVTVRRLTGKRGADVIIETVGESTWARSIKALGKGGRLVTSGATSGPIGPTDIRYLFRREHRILGSNGWLHRDVETVARLAFAGKLRPVIDRVLPLERTAEGELALERREVFGKLAI